MTPGEVKEAMLKDASSGKLSWLFNRFSPNKMLYIGNI